MQLISPRWIADFLCRLLFIGMTALSLKRVTPKQPLLVPYSRRKVFHYFCNYLDVDIAIAN